MGLLSPKVLSIAAPRELQAALLHWEYYKMLTLQQEALAIFKHVCEYLRALPVLMQPWKTIAAVSFSVSCRHIFCFLRKEKKRAPSFIRLALLSCSVFLCLLSTWVVGLAVSCKIFLLLCLKPNLSRKSKIYLCILMSDNVWKCWCRCICHFGHRWRLLWIGYVL